MKNSVLWDKFKSGHVLPDDTELISITRKPRKIGSTMWSPF
jgi:hypothetical protein